MDTLFIEAFSKDDYFFVNIETLITIFTYKISNTNNLLLTLKLTEKKPDVPIVKVGFNELKFEIRNDFPVITNYCVWPIIVSNNRIIGGLCSILRHVIKLSEKNETKKLLGFREACLMACSETSIWTRFCEIDIVKTISSILTSTEDCFKNENIIIPADIARFEFHMKQPVRMHNVYKVAREKNKNLSIESSTPIEDLNLEHCFGEGPFMTLADIVLYPCYKIFFNLFTINVFENSLPQTIKWYQRMITAGLPKLEIDIKPVSDLIKNVVEPEIAKHSLYTADPNRYRPEKRIFTKQDDIDFSIKCINNLEVNIKNNFLPYGFNVGFNWDDIPIDANPTGGALPKKRASRKCEQLENLAKAVIEVVGGHKYKIVDFCSGSGHLGILLAYLLPTSEIILVENKERSLDRAMERINKLNLKNITIVQSNLDYYVGDFDVGVSLHACGVATDLVMQHCLDRKAHFISCPCCYGGIKNCHHLTYPRSKQFKQLNLELKDYLSLAHAADQTHDLDNVKTSQGYLCMDIIDTDRKCYAESLGYEVHLGKLQPTTCTNKNNLIIGIYKSKMQ